MYPLVREPLAGVLNRELNLLGFSGGPRDSDVVAVQLPEQVVESAPKVVNDVARDDANSEPQHLWDCCNVKDVITRLTVQLGAKLDKIGVIGGSDALHRADYGFQAIAMLLRPLDLGPRVPKVDSHSHIQKGGRWA
jgi:hypothetical protein